MYPYDAAVFDLDGTLLNTLDDLADSTNYALTCCGFPRRSLSEVRRFVGNGVANLIARAVPDGTGAENTKQCLEVFRAHYLTNMRNKTAPYPGILQLLDALNRAGIRVAVVSNKFDAAVKGLCHDYFGQRVAVAIGESASVRKKPAPDSALAALDALGVAADRAVYIGDSDVDIETARAAGMDCLSVTWGFRDADFLLDHGARQLVPSVSELAKCLGIHC
ncbi:HAD-IA family hydrolase [Pseudoflavonifractor phocaeensis]|uniref:HAD family hydrolase n=1 Tax=Pseudoflavonifractor phocaeensis TaxID=1870988 RepID=UPI00195B9F8C|nr:HAD-IA family hydrolase [Pseudoflavonifractor phocaeensis]MBM6869049.1 HAD-IA family hydrolase [Pseudoflavonifractor phocaeensis]MBM6937306.1 HAD-IA family hydrolase [Pseudoflavonifractor phocaeensis]